MDLIESHTNKLFKLIDQLNEFKNTLSITEESIKSDQDDLHDIIEYEGSKRKRNMLRMTNSFVFIKEIKKLINIHKKKILFLLIDIVVKYFSAIINKINLKFNSSMYMCIRSINRLLNRQITYFIHNHPDYDRIYLIQIKKIKLYYSHIKPYESDGIKCIRAYNDMFYRARGDADIELIHSIYNLMEKCIESVKNMDYSIINYLSEFDIDALINKK